nr:immunoglobulin heavy chain junction region [Mus musculus]
CARSGYDYDREAWFAYW